MLLHVFGLGMAEWVMVMVMVWAVKLLARLEHESIIFIFIFIFIVSPKSEFNAKKVSRQNEGSNSTFQKFPAKTRFEFN